MASRSRRISELNFDSSQREDSGFQAADGTRDHCATPTCSASSHILLDRSSHRAEDSMGVWFPGRSGSLASSPIPIDRRDIFSRRLEEALSRSNNPDSDYCLVSCPKLLCFARFVPSNAASKDLDSTRHLLNHLSPRHLVHYP